ncbi:hypothetical protein CCACVL1_23515 [Corchorus capsularis]|uniref:Uncharacterized protein n=1 Tax=Corchorus capsularis TaxID=210143 RepID=A0A1R3GTN7_COCAP|nr:hypothetical protein CCACVL1_23515 [Corchorus capsularis]
MEYNHIRLFPATLSHSSKGFVIRSSTRYDEATAASVDRQDAGKREYLATQI